MVMKIIMNSHNNSFINSYLAWHLNKRKATSGARISKHPASGSRALSASVHYNEMIDGKSYSISCTAASIRTSISETIVTCPDLWYSLS
jgi:hypothetical protein